MSVNRVQARHLAEKQNHNKIEIRPDNSNDKLHYCVYTQHARK